MKIHPTAIVDPDARLHASVEVGPYSIIEAGTAIGAGCVIESSARICRGTRLGRGNRVGHNAVLGGAPQHLAFDPHAETGLLIGDGNTVREGANISRALHTGDATRIGDGNYFMCNTHAGHDCVFGSRNVVAPGTMIGGHVEIGDHVFISGLVAIHQFCRIGDYAMIGGCAKIVKDIPPYVTADGNPATVIGLNTVGLRRAGFPPEVRTAIKRAYKIIYHSDLSNDAALETLRESLEDVFIGGILRFIETSRRGLTRHRGAKP